ncbi:MAG: spore photoproduct lyase family protein, partial [Gammaproteobacteria bacterium]
NFRLQKRRPALVIARKHKNFVLEAPPGYAIGADKNFYFSHMLNCLYDCRYCFLQGMYRSANYVLFVNFEDFQTEIRSVSEKFPSEDVHFFSGYDCDSLALEPVSGFAAEFLPFFETLPNAWLELRTKSTQIRSLLNRPAHPRCIAAFSFTPQETASAIEHKAPSVERRIDAMRRLGSKGWKLGLRFDPLIYQAGYRKCYRRLFERIFSSIDADALHSVSMGTFRMPENFFKTIRNLYPEEKLFAGPLETRRRMVSYRAQLEKDMLETCSELLLGFVPAEKYFPCAI